MTSEEAVRLASEYVIARGLPVGHAEAARHMSAERFNELYNFRKYESDFWVVEFGKILPSNVLFEDPAGILIIVEDGSGRVYKDLGPGIT
jgi:hypothetical protein